MEQLCAKNALKEAVTQAESLFRFVFSGILRAETAETIKRRSAWIRPEVGTGMSSGLDGSEGAKGAKRGGGMNRGYWTIGVDIGLGFGSAQGFSGWERDGKRVMIQRRFKRRI